MKENILNLLLIITTCLIIAVLGIYIFKTTKNNTQENEALLNKYTKEKEFQWHTFWNLIRLNMENWCNA